MSDSRFENLCVTICVVVCAVVLAAFLTIIIWHGQINGERAREARITACHKANDVTTCLKLNR